MTSAEEKRNKQWGLIASISIHAVLIILFFFLMAWREPNPPLPDYGIELNFGMETTGGGDVTPTQQPTVAAAEPEPQQAEAPQPQPVEEIAESEPETESSPEPVVEEVSPAATEESNPVSKVESPVPVEEEKPKPEPKREEKKEEPKPQPKPEVKKESPKQAEAETKPDPQPTQAEKAPTRKEGDEGRGETTESNQASQGDKRDQVGDKGDPQGSVDARALYGRRGGGDGPSLEISGWNWDRIPDQGDDSAENGRIVIEFRIDSDGYVTRSRVLESTVSPQVAKFYRDQVEGLTFSKTSDNARPAPETTGRVTFVIKSR